MAVELSMEYTVSISECDPRGHWRPSAILIVMQEMAEVHAASFGLSRMQMIESGVVWVLYRQHIEMDRYPTFGEKVRFTTWPGALEGPIFPRHFVITDAQGREIGRAATSWILMDVKTRRPMRPSALPGKVPANLDRGAPLPLPGMLRVTGDAPLLTRTVQFSDLDVNGHMNNTRYIDWVCDALPLESLLDKGLASFQINYISEALPGEALQLSTLERDGATLFSGKRLPDERPVFEARIALGR